MQFNTKEIPTQKIKKYKIQKEKKKMTNLYASFGAKISIQEKTNTIYKEEEKQNTS